MIPSSFKFGKNKFLQYHYSKYAKRFSSKIPFVLGLFLSIVLTSCAEQSQSDQNLENPFANVEWIDLTHDFEKDTHYWPNVEGFELDTVFEGITDRDYYYSAYSFSGAEHGGTHIDAPIHFAKGGKSVDEIPISDLTGYAIVIDVRDSVEQNSDYQISTDDFKNWEKENGEIPDGAIVLLQTGYDQYWSDKEQYMGTTEMGESATKHLHFPGLAPEAGEWLVKNRSIKATGLDTASIDYGPSLDFRSHQVLCGNGIPGFENLKNLDKLATKGDYIIALPMKIKGGSGGPLRIVAMKRH